MDTNSGGSLNPKQVTRDWAAALFRDGHLSLVRSARMAEMGTAQFASHASRLGIEVIRLDSAEATQDIDTLDEWPASS